MSFAHFYFSTPLLDKLNTFNDDFKSFYTFDMYNLPEKLPNIDILYIEIDEVTKEKFVIINTLVKKFPSKKVVLFTSNSNNSFLLKFALHFSIDRVLEMKNDESYLKKAVSNSIIKFYEKQNEKQQLEISKRISSFFALLIFKKEHLIFANEKAYEVFDSNDINVIESLIKNNESIYTMLVSNQNENRVVVMKNAQGEDWKYNFFLNVLPNGVDKLLSIIPHRKIEESDDISTLNRFQFVEVLKDKLAQNSFAYNDMSLILINVSNYDKLVKVTGSLKVHDFIKKFILKLMKYKEPYEVLTQWSPNFFVILVENDSFDAVKERLDSLHQKLIYNEIDKEISPIIISSVLHLYDDNINRIILHVENIAKQSITPNDFKDNEYFEIHHFSDYMSEEEQIEHYFHSCIANKTNLKLLNIYKGLCINTQSKIIRADGDAYFFSFEALQGYSMEVEEKTVIQSPDLPYDISASVTHVNFDKSMAFLNNFQFLTSSANNRQYTRVQPASRTPLIIKYEKFVYQGEIIDISINSVAIKFAHRVNKVLLNEFVHANFKLPDESEEYGYVELKIEAKIVYIGDYDKIYCKVVLMLEDLKKPYDSYMLKYMYVRQKELIIELKKSARANAIGRR